MPEIIKGRGLKKSTCEDWKSLSFNDRQKLVNQSVLMFAIHCLAPSKTATRRIGRAELLRIYRAYIAVSPVEVKEVAFHQPHLFIFHLKVLLPWHYQERRRVRKGEVIEGAIGDRVPAHFCNLETVRDWAEPGQNLYDLVEKHRQDSKLIWFYSYEMEQRKNDKQGMGAEERTAGLDENVSLGSTSKS